MSRLGRSAVALLGAAATALCTLSVVPSAGADPLTSAKAQAAALTKTVARLQTQAEVATENYDATQSQLNVAVAQRVLADQELTAVDASVEDAEATVGNQAQMLYENGNPATLLTSILTSSSPASTASSYQLASDVVAAQRARVQAARATLDKARGLEQRDAAISRSVINLQRVRSAQAASVETLLAQQRHALAAANGTVLRIVRADQRAAAAASQAQFVSAVGTAGGTINPNGPITAPNNVAAIAIAAAHSRLGVPYVWGATGPGSFDCSGLTQWSYAHAGVTLPRTAAEQWNAGPHPSLADLEPGDLLFWALNTSDPATIHHVAMYIGHGLMIAAPHTGENVQIQPVYDQGLIGAMRPWGTATAATPTPTASATP
jgi:cell wall-associated NlpC family hydrolase